ncbi:MAG TPA: DNA polymerase III subunit delta, partial [Candidatus Syntrophosphaera sp.]|nr:DNA polymerase III subunit delta [Candidatus Syntrophosphaera sp.]
MTAVPALKFDPQKVSLGQNYLLLGGDAYLTDMVADVIYARLAQSAAPDRLIVYCDEVKATELNDLLDAYSIFSSSKMILLRNAELLKKQELETLAAYFTEPSDGQTLVVTADKVDARVAGWKKIRDVCQVVTCDPPRFSSELVPLVNLVLSRLGIRMSESAKSLFINRVELDFASVYNELQKLGLLLGARKLISDEDIIRSIGISRVGTQIEFFRSLGNRQSKTCLQLLEKMLSSDWAPLQVLFLINRFYFSIYKIMLLRENHFSATEIIRAQLPEHFESQRAEFVRFSDHYRI